jgi:hypothetical protein
MSTEQSLLTNLSAALNSRGPEEVQRALTSYLKADEGMSLPPVKSNMFKPQSLNASCGISAEAGAEASECANLIERCVKGENDCIEEFVNLSDKIARGVVFTSKADDQIIRNVLRSLGIDINEDKPVEKWLVRITSKNAEAAAKIAGTTNLIKVLKTFVVKALNPSFNTDEVQESLVVGDSKIPMRKGLASEKVIIAADQIPKRRSPNAQNGGGDENQPKDTYTRYIEGIKEILNMRGGADEVALADTYEHFAGIYQSFIDRLKSQGKQIDPSDDAHIRQLLSLIKTTEEKLNKVTKYIIRYKALESHPEMKDKLGNPITIQTLEELNKKYEELKSSYKSKAGDFSAILDSIHKVFAAGPEKMPERNEALKRISEQMKKF